MILDRIAHSLRGKIVLVVLTTTMAALSVTAVALVVYDLNTYERSRVSDLVSLANIIARGSAPALAFDDPKAARGNLALLNVRPGITAAAVYEKNGEMFANYGVESGANQQSASRLPPRIAAGTQMDGYRIEGGEIVVFQRILENNEVLGNIYLRALYEPLVRLQDYLTILVTVMVASMLLALLISIGLQRRITEPIFEITAVARQVMEKRDFSLRVNKTTSDEIGVLVDAFNSMLGEVGRRSQALEAFNRVLEHETRVRRGAEEALRENDRRKDEFLATLAHELRNPLAPLRNALEILRLAGNDQVKAGAAREMMGRQVKQMVRLVDDLLDVSRITTGKLAIQKERIDLHGVVRTALETAGPVFEARKQTLVVDIPPQPIALDADPVRLAQVLSNLLNNAAKYTDVGGRISLSAECENDQLVISITDNGIGISSDMLSAIFNMFTQVDYSLERAQAGLGVGLTLARHLVELHDGSIEAHSDGLGRGSQFVVRLPMAPAAPATQDWPDTPSAAADSAGSHRILVVDDNVDFALSLTSLMESLGNEVKVAHDGPQALAIVADFKPDFAFLDVGLPGLNGYDLVQEMRKQPNAAKAVCVAVTGWGQDKDRQRSREAGFDHHLTKPIELADVEAILTSRAPKAWRSQSEPVIRTP